MISGTLARALRYGENPHQKAAFYARRGAAGPSLARAEVLQGKELSYNNLLDLDAAMRLVRRVRRAGRGDRQAQQPLRRRRRPGGRRRGLPAGAARPIRSRPSAASWRSTGPSTRRAGARAVGDLPRVRDRAGLRARGAGAAGGQEEPAPARRRDLGRDAAGAVELRSVAGGFLVQTRDRDTAAAPPTARSPPSAQPTAAELRDLDFAWRVCKHVKSNAIVFAADGRTLGIGAGQMSRVDSVRIAVSKARAPLAGSAVASDAFFPFRDGVDEAAKAGALRGHPAGRLDARRRGHRGRRRARDGDGDHRRCGTSGTRMRTDMRSSSSARADASTRWPGKSRQPALRAAGGGARQPGRRGEPKVTHRARSPPTPSAS